MSLRGQCRHITLRHERHLLNNTSPALAPGEAKFSSYYLPSLPAGEYKIAIDQAVYVPSNGSSKRADPAKRSFEVLAPEWALSVASNGDSDTTNTNDEESAVVLSTFPAPGQTAPSFRTLPHLVLRDAQLPWVRNVSEQNFDYNHIPWFALIVFSAEELELSDALRPAFFSKANATINDTLGWDLNVNDIDRVQDKSLANFIPGPSEPDRRAKTRTSVITVPSDVFRKLFTSKKDASVFDVSPFRFMSHVRTVSTAGTLSAGLLDNDGDPETSGTQTLSVVVSHRLGPTNIQVPTPVLAHLVSLQGIYRTPVNVLDNKSHVLMTSLFSWTYTAMPPNSKDVYSMLRHLGNKEAGLSVLRTDLTQDAVAANDADDDDSASSDQPGLIKVSREEEMVTKRQKDGYTLVRYRTVTGEQTAAMYRGPLSPTRVPYPLNKEVSFQSNFGTDLQILDPNLGLMDISYASAWQLGKTMAMADPAFTAALSRLRTLVHQEALEKARKTVFQQLRGCCQGRVTSQDGAKLSIFSDQNPCTTYMPQEEIKSDIAGVVKALNGMNKTVHGTGTSFSTNRWNRRGRRIQSALEASSREDEGDGEGGHLWSLRSQHIYYQMPVHSLHYCHDNAEDDQDGRPYHYHAIPKNTDYAVIQEWVLNHLHLAGIPAHYLLPDPSHVPEESLRFFHVDANWQDALVDGALSLANHLAGSPEKDYIRSSLKETLNRYFSTPIKDDYCQQIPAYGFILRSQLLVQFPDLAVDAEFKDAAAQANEGWADAKPKAPILVQRRLAADMMLVLMDREPPNLTSVTFTLPAHQQTFIAAIGLSETEIDLRPKRVYATGADLPVPEPRLKERRKTLHVPGNPLPTAQLFDWEARTIKIEAYAEFVHNHLKQNMPNKTKDYNAPAPTAAVLSLQLNEPIYTLVVTAERPQITSHEPLDSWHLLHEAKGFRFHPPAFPTHEHKPKAPLPVPSRLPAILPTQLSLTTPDACESSARGDRAKARGDGLVDNWAMVQAADLGTEIPPAPSDPVYPTLQPKFDFQIFPIGRAADKFIPTNTNRPVDLVFSILRGKTTTPAAWPMRITRWDLVIQIADPSTHTRPPPNDLWKSRALLRSDMPDSPPPVMLSNLRYNVLIRKWDTDKGLLHMSIVPRSKWGVLIRDTPDASFLLPMAPIFPWEVPKGKAYPCRVELISYMVSKNDADKKEYKFEHSQDFKLKSPS